MLLRKIPCQDIAEPVSLPTQHFLQDRQECSPEGTVRGHQLITFYFLSWVVQSLSIHHYAL